MLPFLVSYHQRPVFGFYAEWLAGALGLLAVVAASGSRFGRVALPAPARWLAAFALLLAVHAAIGKSAYVQMPMWGTVYVLYAVLMVWLGAQLTQSAGLDRTVDVLAQFILAGALANALAGIVQFYGRPAWLEVFVADSAAWQRVYGNIVQANLYANYLALGQASLLFLWRRGRVRASFALAAALLLVWASGLSGSRSAVLYAAWFAAWAAIALGRAPRADMRRLFVWACALVAAVAAGGAVLGYLNEETRLAAQGRPSFGQLFQGAADLRWSAWPLALQLFASAPLTGVGMGEFGGAAFNLGLPRDMSAAFPLWNSAHNLILQLMAETGFFGALLVVTGLGYWWFQIARRYYLAPEPALWWLIGTIGVESIHSMLEYPMWYAHFLGLTALVIGTGAVSVRWSPIPAMAGRIAGSISCVVLAAVLFLALRDYWRLELTWVTGTSATLARQAPKQDAETLMKVRSGLFAPVAELWLFTGASLDRRDLDEKLQISERVMRYWPSPPVIMRRAIFLGLAGRAREAVLLLGKVPPLEADAMQAVMRSLRIAEGADPVALRPLVAAMEAANKSSGRPEWKMKLRR